MDEEQINAELSRIVADLRRADHVLRAAAQDIENGRLRFTHATVEQVYRHLAHVNHNLSFLIGARDTVIL